MSITLNPGSGGSVVASESDGTAEHELVIVEWGPTSTRNRTDDATGKRLPVKLGEIDATLKGTAGGLKIEDVSSSAQITLQASQVAAVVNGTTTRTITTGLGNYVDAIILINITAGGVATGTLTLYLQTSYDGGITWDDVCASNPFSFGAAGTTQVFAISGRISTSISMAAPQSLDAMTPGNMRVGPWGDRLRVREKVSGVSGTPTGATYTINGVFKR